MPQKAYSPNASGVKVRDKDDGCCGIFFLKYVLYIFNLIFWLSGGALIAIGVWTLLMKHSYITLLSSGVYPTTTYLLIATGALIIIVGIIGCCGAWHEKPGCLMAYATFLLLIFLLEAVIGILAYMYEAALQSELTRNLNQTMIRTYQVDDEKTAAIDSLHQEFHCCGAGGFKDWRESRWLVRNPELNLTAPDSCCITPSQHCAHRDHPNNIYYTGCVEELHAFLKRHLIIVGSVGLGICCLQLFGIVFACMLAMRIKQWKRRQKANYWS